MGRKLRKVPADWEHPKDENGEYCPMFDEYYGDALNDWIEQHRQWEAGTHPDLIKHPERKVEFPHFAMWDDNPPDIAYYQVKKYAPEELTHIQLYEDTTEGTPITPVFPADKLEDLCEYAAEHCSTFADYKATKEDWMSMLTDKRGVYHTIGNVTFI